jgi:hypothetical protein
MKTRLVLRPGQRGTLQLSRIYGDRLLFVRYRYDIDRRIRLKTIELVVDEAPWSPDKQREPDASVYIVTSTKELALHARIRQAGGRWNNERGAWCVSYAQAKSLGLIGRIIDDGA